MNEIHRKKTALVTGAASGLGFAAATALAEANFQVVGLDVRQFDHPSCMTTQLGDVSDAADIDRVVTEVNETIGPIDAVVNSAGVDHTYWLEQMTVAQFDQIIGVNPRGPFLVAKVVWPIMKANGGGHIVNVASTAAVRVWSGAAAYHAFKFGLIGLSRAMKLEGRQDRIRVTTIIPGGMDTGFFARFAEQGIPAPDPATLQNPADVARAIVFALSSPASSAIQELVVTPPNEPGWP